MDLAGYVRLMARNNAWSNHRLLRACSSLHPGEFFAARTSFFPSLQATLNHILAVDCYYIDALEMGGLGPSAFGDYQAHGDADSLLVAQSASDKRLIDLCDRETQKTLQSVVVTDRGDAGAFNEIRINLFMHLFLHQIHHRGQAHAMLAGSSVKPPQIDEYLLEFDREARAKDLSEQGLEGPEAFR
ncbi:MAG: DinB family protein [Beijerinckiaceae bacterium]